MHKHVFFPLLWDTCAQASQTEIGRFAALIALKTGAVLVDEGISFPLGFGCISLH
jgi:hypothetical protein